jgi:hypothetical protein
VSAALQRWRGALVGAALLALALAIYLPYALKGGWYYDDWALYANFKDAGSSWSSRFDACTAAITGGRKLTCLYHSTIYQLLTDHRTAYHLVAIVFLAAIAILLYAILRRCHLRWTWSALAAALVIVFPANDATRLWPTGAIGQYVVVLELVGVLLALAALGRRPGWRRAALDGGAVLLFVVALASYEIAVPLVALNGIVYWFAYRNRAALVRGAADLGLAVLFVLYRLVLNPVDPSDGFTVHRTLHGDLSRAWTLVGDAWRTWHEVFVPGTLGLIGVLAVLAVSLLLALRDERTRRRMLPWAALLAAGLVVSFAATFVFFTANDLYVPQIGTVFNRVTLPATIPYVCVFVALLGLGYEVLRRLVPVPWVAPLAVGLVALASGWHQLNISSDHKRLYEASWSEQRRALAGYRVAVRGIPRTSRVIGFGAPLWEPDFIPVFSAFWDLRGALDYETPVDPALASPLTEALACGRRGLLLEGAPLTPYVESGSPLYFIDAEGARARRVRNRGQCVRTIRRWGRPPFFASLPPTGPS